jgi:hypothetical protein
VARGNCIKLQEAAKYIRRILVEEDELAQHHISTQWLALMADDLDDLANKLMTNHINGN